ncbi:uncharacterized protein [Amphiura filiformis]|uniref:uncharacterized protein n=1 Tax=Amphiura filiformis TaxID=82378 RepID=UPI003B21C484
MMLANSLQYSTIPCRKHLVSVIALIALVLITVCSTQLICIDYQHPNSTMCYSRDELLQMRSEVTMKLPTNLWQYITSLGIRSEPIIRRGRRGGKRHPRVPPVVDTDADQYSPIPTIIGNRPKPNELQTPRYATCTNLRQLPHYGTMDSKLNVCLWNAQSLGNKTVLLVDYMLEHDIDIMILTETWLRDDDRVIIGESTPPGYSFLNISRPNNARGGGIAIIFKTPLNLSLRKSQCVTKYFESACITDNANRLNLVAIYRPPPSPENRFRHSDFIAEFDNFVDDISILPGKMLLVGDFNVHWDRPDKSDVIQFSNIITSANLMQHVDRPTHTYGHILDHVFTVSDDNLVLNCTVDESFIADRVKVKHHCVHFNVNLEKPLPERVTQVLRNYKDINDSDFENSLSQHFNDIPLFENPGDIFDWYNQVVRATLDELAPATTRSRSIRCRMPWYNNSVHQSRQERRRKERKWRKSRSENDRLEFTEANKNVKTNITIAKKDYFGTKLHNASTKEVFQVMNQLLNNQGDLFHLTMILLISAISLLISL